MIIMISIMMIRIVHDDDEEVVVIHLIDEMSRNMW